MVCFFWQKCKFYVARTLLYSLVCPQCQEEFSSCHTVCCCSVTQSCLTLQSNGLQHSRLPYRSPSPRPAQTRPLSQWCHPTISSSVVPSSSCHQSFPELGSFLMSQLFASGGQSIGVSASTSVLPMNIQGWFPLGLTDLICFQSKGLWRVFSNITIQKHQFFGAQSPLWSNSHIHTWLLQKSALTIQTFVGKVMSLHFNMLSKFVIAFLPRSKHLLISWLQSPSAVILKTPPPN